MHLFVFVHQNYDYDQLCEEIESIQRDEDESIADFDLRLIQHSCIFHDDDRTSKKDYTLFRFSLIFKCYFEDERKLFFGDVDSN